VVDRKGMCERQLQTFGARLAQLNERQPSATDPSDGYASGGVWQPVNQPCIQPCTHVVSPLTS